MKMNQQNTKTQMDSPTKIILNTNRSSENAKFTTRNSQLDKSNQSPRESIQSKRSRANSKLSTEIRQERRQRIISLAKEQFGINHNLTDTIA